jgi:UDP-hydrolysing UDP-N-acetyl-D-glucosamine 2-epimerase
MCRRILDGERYLVKKICVVVASRANYGRVKYLMRALRESQLLELQLIVGASVLLERFGGAIEVIKDDGFIPNRSIHYVIEGETLETQAKSTGLGILELSTAFADLRPDAVITVADRFETMSTAIASTYQNIPLIHLQGGEVSGNIDDRVRNAVTKLADFHFVATVESEKRVIEMGEDPKTVFNFGCPAMDVLKNIDLDIDSRLFGILGVGAAIDWHKPYILIMQHPVTTSYGSGYEQILKTLNACKKIEGVQKVVMWPNVDAGSDDVSKGIRHFRENNGGEPYRYFKNFSPEDYCRLLNGALCVVGNSSSFIRECSYLGVPAVLVGDRQAGREHGKNVIFAQYSESDIAEKINRQIKHGKYSEDFRFGNGYAGIKIAKKIEELLYEKNN